MCIVIEIRGNGIFLVHTLRASSPAYWILIKEGKQKLQQQQQHFTYINNK